MKNKLLLLVSILLPLISSCNIKPTAEPTIEPTIEPTVEPTVESTVEPTPEPTAEPTVEPSEEIYYLDGLASNLFVTEVPENVRIRYSEINDYYSVTSYTEIDGTVYENIDCVIPNVYDDGVHGLKRVKKFYHSGLNYKGYYNTLTISEGIEIIYDEVGEIAAKEIYFPSTIKKMNYCWSFEYFDKEEHGNIEMITRYYNGTVEQFNTIEGFRGTTSMISDTPFKVEFICLDGIAYFEFYEAAWPY